MKWVFNFVLHFTLVYNVFPYTRTRARALVHGPQTQLLDVNSRSAAVGGVWPKHGMREILIKIPKVQDSKGAHTHTHNIRTENIVSERATSFSDGFLLLGPREPIRTVISLSLHPIFIAFSFVFALFALTSFIFFAELEHSFGRVHWLRSLAETHLPLRCL